jgi:uncharacterized membrane protein YraQ (UPF0718 family)
MSTKKKGHPMLVPTLIMATVAAALFVVALSLGRGQHIQGLRIGWVTLRTTLPLLVFAFIVAGMVQTPVPAGKIAGLVGRESGWRGIVLGCVAGGLAPGGPYVSLPLALTLYKSGAGIGVMVSFLTAWSLWAFARLPMEVGIPGMRLTLIRLVTVLLFPPLAGAIAQAPESMPGRG